MSWGCDGAKGVDATRRWTDRLRGGLVAVLLTSMLAPLAGCQTAPPVSTAKPGRDTALRSMGFEPGPDGWMLGLSTPILFEIDRAELQPATREALVKMAETLRKIGVERIRVEGHTDDVGSLDYNVDLSYRRAVTDGRELAEAGFPPEAIVLRGLGYRHPAAPNDTADGRALNRRVTIMVLAPDAATE